MLLYDDRGHPATLGVLSVLSCQNTFQTLSHSILIKAIHNPHFLCLHGSWRNTVTCGRLWGSTMTEAGLEFVCSRVWGPVLKHHAVLSLLPMKVLRTSHCCLFASLSFSRQKGFEGRINDYTWGRKKSKWVFMMISLSNKIAKISKAYLKIQEWQGLCTN